MNNFIDRDLLWHEQIGQDINSVTTALDNGSRTLSALISALISQIKTQVADSAEQAIFRQTMLELQGVKESTKVTVREMVEREPVRAMKIEDAACNPTNQRSAEVHQTRLFKGC